MVSLRARLLLAFAVMAMIMGAVTVLAITALREQTRLSVTADQRQDRIVDAIAVLGATPFEAEGLVLNHLNTGDPAAKAQIAASLLAADTREALALADLASLAEGAEASVVADLRLQADHAADLRARLLAISTRNAHGRAVTLTTQALPQLRAALGEAMEAVAGPSGQALAAARAEAAMNAIAVAQKNALLNGEAGFVTAQLASAALARAEFKAQVGLLLDQALPARDALQLRVDDFARVDSEVEGLVRDSGADTADTLYSDQLLPLDRTRLATLDTLAALLETGRRSVDQAALQAVGDWQAVLVLLADAALILGLVAVVLGLGKIGRGLEAAVRLAERMAQGEVAPPAWVQRNLSGRLTAALVQISAGQTAVLAALDALAVGRAPRNDLPDRLREKVEAVAARIRTAPPDLSQGVARARVAAGALQATLETAMRDGQEIREGAERLVEALDLPARRVAEVDEAAEAAARHALVTERHLATLIAAEREGSALAEGLGLAPGADPLARPLPEVLRIA